MSCSDVNFFSFLPQVEALKKANQGLGGALDSAWLCLCGALVMFMHAGFAMLETGSCRAKNCSNVLMKNLVNVCVGTLGWWSLGWPLHTARTTASLVPPDSSAGTSTLEMQTPV